MIDFITFCDYTGTFAFAISGIRLASAKQFDWFGAYVVGVVTAVGGGTIRDILLNAVPFWKSGCMKPSLRGIMAICVGGQLSPLTEMKIQRSFTAYEK